jgi:excisionase family DNA binding protein
MAGPQDRLPSGGPDSPVPGPELLTIAEVARMARVSKMTIYRLVHDGHLPALRVGQSYRIPSDAVRTLLRARDGRGDVPGNP